MPDSSSLLAAAGSLLYGPQWVSALARALDVNLRTMQRWAAGEYEPPGSLWAEIDGLLMERQTSIAALRKRLRG